MARARNIKPGFFTNEELVELSFFTRLLFIGLWTISDREGRLEDKPKRIKMNLFPADDVNVDAALTELEKSGFLARYSNDGNRYIQVLAFKKHQNPHKDEKASTIPAPCEHHASTVQRQEEHSSNPADSLIPDSLIPDSLIPDSLIPDSLIPDSLIPDSLIPETSGKPAARGMDYPPEFEEVWQEYPKRPGASKRDSSKAWKARIESGVDPEDLLCGVRNYAAYVKAKGVEPDFIKQPATFFGPGEHYKADWTIHPPRASPYQTKTEKTQAWIDELTGANRAQNDNIIDIN